MNKKTVRWLYIELIQIIMQQLLFETMLEPFKLWWGLANNGPHVVQFGDWKLDNVFVDFQYY